MRVILKAMSVLAFVVSAQAFASGTVENGGYVCKQQGDSVCAMSKRTGQCTHQWDRGDGGDPMFFCKKYIGLNPGGSVNWSNYYCKDMGDYVCAVSKIHGQCGASWSKRDGGDAMYFCQKQLGLIKRVPKKGRYTCRDMGNYVCAVSNATGQCTNTWETKEGGMHQCLKFINN